MLDLARDVMQLHVYLVPHRHSLKTPRKKKSCDFPERVAQRCTPVLDSNPSLPRCGPRLAPHAPARVAAPRHERGFRRYLSAAFLGGGKSLMLRVKGENGGCSVPPTQSRDRGLIVPALGRRLALLRRRRQQGPGRGCANSTSRKHLRRTVGNTDRKNSLRKHPNQRELSSRRLCPFYTPGMQIFGSREGHAPFSSDQWASVAPPPRSF